MDLYGEGIHYARSRTTCPLVQGDVRKSPFGKTFQVIGIFDVLEHIPDDNRILVDLWELLENGGTLLLTVPANPSLWSYFDELAGHCRRYEAADLRSKLEKAGFAIEYLTPYMATLSPLMWLSRGFRAKTAANADARELLEQELRVVPVLNGPCPGKHGGWLIDGNCPLAPLCWRSRGNKPRYRPRHLPRTAYCRVIPRAAIFAFIVL